MDIALERELERQGIDKSLVKLTQDFAPRYVAGKKVKGRSPYAQFYRDDASKKRFMVVSGLPMVNHLGQRAEPKWITAGPLYQSLPNLFRATVSGLEVTLRCINQQPSGVKPGDAVVWQPQLFVDGSEVLPTTVKASLLDVDPTNPDLEQNTLEWDYGICKRRLRLLQGRIRERWVFGSDPHGEVKIKHNVSGADLLRFGEATDALVTSLVVTVIDDEEIIAATEFENPELVYPVTIGASATYYPDADPESTSVDGNVSIVDSGGRTWAAIHDAGTGTGASTSSSTGIFIDLYADGNTDEWQGLYRTFILFDTSALPDGATISAAVVSVYGVYKLDEFGASVNVYSSNPASNTALITADYDALGTTPFCDTPITYSAFSTSGYNDWTLNATGRAAVSKTGITKLSIRESVYDAPDSEPTWASTDRSYVQAYAADQGSNKPKLVVTYSVGWTGQVMGVTDPGKIYGVSVADITSVMGVS